MPQKQYKPHYEHLKNKWLDRQDELQKSLWEKHKDALNWFVMHLPGKQHLVAGSLSSLVLAISPQIHAITALKSIEPKEVVAAELDKGVFLINDLANTVPSTVRPLAPEEEDRIAAILSTRFGFRVTPELQGTRLNRSYGYIGAEQHLALYPGDMMSTHFAVQEESLKYYSSGMAPGLGAWGYFAPSRSEMIERDVLREKYYIAVQTFLAPEFQKHVSERYNFFKYRKMLVVNPNNGKAMVVVIGDAGPAEWTGKSLGGSPEVMKYLERVDGKARGPVLYFFVDDPDDTIPLGPVEVK